MAAMLLVPPEALRLLLLQRNELIRWLINDALPLWETHGVDWENGGYFESLSIAPISDQVVAAGDVRRGRVVARQIFVFDAGRRLGFEGKGLSPVSHGCRYLFDRLYSGRGTFHTAVNARSGAPCSPFSLYEHAFYLYALARVHGSLAREFPTAETALACLDRLQLDWGKANGGFEETLPPSLPLKSNPHMHLLEAALAWIDAAEEADTPRWVDLAQELVNLSLDKFIDADTGALREYFDASWWPVEGAEGRIVEPGHQFEWAWLLMQWADVTYCSANQSRACHAAAKRLIENAERWGVDQRRGVAFNELWDDMSSKDLDAKLWPQTERVKAWSSLLRHAETSAEAAAACTTLSSAITGLNRYIHKEPPGMWQEVMMADGRFSSEACKASSFYHIVCSIQTLDDTLKDLDIR